MKKALLLTSLVASMVAMAGTTGSVEGYNENEATFVKGAKPTFVAKKTGVKTEVKVEGTGFSFGGDFKAEDLELGKVTKANYLNHSSVWAKYELPELTKGLNVYVKGTVSPKFAEDLDYTSVPEDNKLKEDIKKILGTESDKVKANKVLVKLAKEKGLYDAIATIKDTDEIDAQVTALATAEKAAIEAANQKVKSYDRGSAELEGQVSYKYDVLTFGFNSKTNFPLSNKTYKYGTVDLKPIFDVAEDYGATVKSTHKVFVESEEGKDVFVKGLKDVKASLEIKHNYKKLVTTPGERVDYVKGNVELAYDGVKDLRIDGKADFTVNVNGPKKLGNIKLGDYNLEDLELGGVVSNMPVNFVHTYNAKLTYTGVKGLTLAVAPFVSHSQLKIGNLLVPALGHTYLLDKDLNNAFAALQSLKFDNVMYGASLNAQYKMLNDQLTLTGKALLSGDSLFVCGINVANLGVVSLGANAKYDYKVSDKFTVSPEADAKLDLYIASPVTVPFLTLTPKVSAEYKPTDTLTLKGSVEAPVKFGPTLDGKFGYQQTQLKTSLNLKYEWK
ncbi:hypothetical protein VC03_00345 [Sneathia vaginalis]|uniref:Uncharacterized protein n=1 Tax=Sneathia vaginalis TaxID=187101 RepID=A0A0E3ZAS5_9FUSO|nr:hypothetical protein [Sneathia vaginalis]AKC95047.1 hypothetical protein VC03_00345 [Sneathia vaginalis]